MRNRLLLGAIRAEALMLAAFVYVSVLSHALGQHALSAGRWLPILIVPWILLAAEETRKAVVRRRHGGVG